MKKFLIISSLVASLAAASANAKTEGSYLGFDLLKANSHFNSISNFSTYGQPHFPKLRSKDSNNNFGLNYKYAFNKDNFFVSPGAFYERLNVKSGASYNTSLNGFTMDQTTKIKDRYGIKLDLGYDITNKFAFYVPVGFAFTNYELTSTQYLFNTPETRVMSKGRNTSTFYGLGFSFYPTEKLAINFEYNRSKLNLKSGNTNVDLNDNLVIDSANIRTETHLDVIKLGVAYKF